LGPLGIPELLFILVLALLIFGPKKLPEIGKTLGKAMGEFRRATTDLKRSIDTEIALEEKKSARPEAPPSPEGTAARDAPGAAAGEEVAEAATSGGDEAEQRAPGESGDPSAAEPGAAAVVASERETPA